MKKIIRALSKEDHDLGSSLVVICSLSNSESGRKGLIKVEAANPMYIEYYDNRDIECKYYKRKDLNEKGWHGELVDYVSDAVFKVTGKTLKDVRYCINRVIKNRYEVKKTEEIASAEEDSETENNYGINAESDLKNLGSLMNKIVNTSDKKKCQQITQEIKNISKAWDYHFGCSMLYIYLQNKAKTEMKNFTKSEIINRDLKKLTLKHGEKWCTKYYEQINRLFNPNKHTIMEYRSAGVVILENKKYIFHAICDMNLKKWSKSFVLDITEEYDNDYQIYSIKEEL